MTVVWLCDFYDFISPFSLKFLFRLRGYSKHSRGCFITFSNTSKFVKKKHTKPALSVWKCDGTLCPVFDMLLRRPFKEKTYVFFLFQGQWDPCYTPSFSIRSLTMLAFRSVFCPFTDTLEASPCIDADFWIITCRRRQTLAFINIWNMKYYIK